MSRDDFVTRFDAQALQTPLATAVFLEGLPALSYAELRERAISLAGWLQAQSIGPEDLVALAMARSPHYLVAMLGVWYAGAAFMPLDPTLPPERRAFMLADANVRLVLDATEPAGRARDLRRQAADPHRLAYVIYTSGSTGRPKGVAVTHAGIVNLLDAQISAFALTSTSRALWLLSPNFDASISDIGTALLAGASIHIEAADTLTDPRRLLDLLAARRITHVDLPPALLAVLDPAHCPPTLQTIVIGGEPCPAKHVRRWAERVRVVNCYGPTEATVCTSLCVCDPHTWHAPLLGDAIANVVYCVVDDELLIAGVALARGYINRPELTAERFIERDQTRWYKSGDRVRTHPDGRLEFLGRIDRQLKIRGRLVAPEEIELALAGHPNVGRAAVLARKVGSPEGPTFDSPLSLIAFIEPAPGRTIEGLHEHLQTLLPAWMIPTRWEVLEALPLGATDKIDLDALASWPLTMTERNSAALGSPQQAALAGIWRRVLGCALVGPDDDFFALGGDSFGVLEMLALGEERGLYLSAALVARYPTLAAMAAETNRGSGDRMSAQALRADVAFDRPWRARLKAASERDVVEEAPPRCMLLTGATGFLGARLLAELLVRTNAEIVCLVRAPSPAKAHERVLDALAEHGVSPAPGRISTLCADLLLPRLGLDARRWSELTARVDTVYHLAACVNLVRTYESLRPANVDATRQVLRFVCEGRRKRLHFASTLSVFVSTDRNVGRLGEDDALDDTSEVYGGYAQSKWAAEVLLRNAAHTIGTINIYRLGLLTGDTTRGRAPQNDLLAMFFRATAVLGCVPAPALDKLAVDITPVDYAAAAIAHLSLGPAAHPATFHIANPQPATLASLIDALRTTDVDIEAVDHPTWRARLTTHLSQTTTREHTTSLLAMCRCLDHEAFERHRATDLFQATAANFDQQNTLAGLQDSGIVCPVASAELLEKYVRWRSP
ncbi:MAG: amino acid adenylation domain-containing protein [Bradymonadaceae bacterium]|nr:amino acid adenylation domain-containing protein [Lujinxingiaceae bacterium]